MLAYMDSNVQRQEDGSLNISIFRKKTHTDQYLDWSSNHHITQKIGIYSTLKHRCDTLVTTEEDQKIEDEHIKTALRRCGHPEWVFNRKKKSKLVEVVDEEEPVLPNGGEEVPEIYGSVRIPYVKSLSERLASTYNKFNIKTFHKPTQKMKSLVCNKMKDPVHPLDRPNPIYRYDCSHFKPAYVGETERQDKVRKYEHGFHSRSEATKVHSLSAEIKTNNTDLIPDSDEEQQVEEQQKPRRSVRQKAKPKVDYKQMHEGKKESLVDPQLEKSVVKRHIRSVDHMVGDMSCSILEYEPEWEKRLFKEAIAIRTLKPSLNEDQGKRHIPHIYDNLFNSEPYKRSHPRYSRADT